MSGGVLTLIADCIVCGRTFTSNPDLVPSVRVHGTREPICRPCVENANRERAARGLSTWTIHPQAYEPGDEHGEY